MATAPSLPSVSEDEYFEDGLWAEFEYVNGTLVPRNIGSRDHARMVSRIDQLLGHYPQIQAYAGFVLSIPWRNTYRVPDICCYPADVDPAETLENQPPPLAIFEVQSKTDTLSNMVEKCDEYHRLGVLHVFIVDPAQLAVLVREGKGLPAKDTDIEFGAADWQVVIGLADLFKGFPGSAL